MTNRTRIFYAIIFICWLFIELAVGIYHEPWADEAQSWLIARDNSYFDLISKVLKYEGHPFLWYFLLRTLHIMNFPYELLFVIPISCTAIGVFLLLFKTKLPNIIKCVFPFTYFIIYQYSIIARSYALFLPLLILIAIYYKDRLKKTIIYSVLLILLMSVSAYSFIIGVTLFVFWTYDIIKSGSINIKSIITIIFTSLFVIATPLYLYTPADCISYEPILVPSVKRICHIFVNGYFNSANNMNILSLISVLVLYILAGLKFCTSKKQALFFIILNLILITVMSAIVCREWHYGHIIITFIFTIAVLCNENNRVQHNKYLNFLFYSFFIFLIIIQISWGYHAIKYDISNNYSASKDIANFIKYNNLEKYGINGLGYGSVAIQPYFKHNIYNNYKTSHFTFSSDFKANNYKKAKELTPVMVYDSSWYIGYKDIIDNLKDYNIYVFDGKITNKGKTEESAKTFVLVNKNIKK